MGASEGTMRSLLGKLGGLLAQEYTLIRGVRGDIQYISDELASMQAFLGDLGSALDDHDRWLKNWMKQIRDMAYDMEDCIDRFMDRLGSGDAKPKFMKRTARRLKTLWARHDIATQIKELKARLIEESERRRRLDLDNYVTVSSSLTREQTVGIDPRPVSCIPRGGQGVGGH